MTNSLTSHSPRGAARVDTFADNPYFYGPKRDAWQQGYNDAAAGRPSAIATYTEIIGEVGAGTLRAAYAQGRRNHAGMK